jgi:hypothetical protein
MLQALKAGFSAVRKNWGLVVLLLLVNLAAAAILAVPLAGTLERELRDTESAPAMMYGFDYAWWSQWSDAQSGWTASFRPDIFGAGFAFKNVDLLLDGQLPGRLFAAPREESDGGPGDGDPPVDGVILALGIAYLLLQVFLTGGLLGVLRAPDGGWTVRGLLHGSGFYFGRFLRVTLLSLIALWVVFRLHAPLGRWADSMARESVSETTAMVWSLGHHALLLLAILFVSMVTNYARVVIVVEERASALLAYLSSLAFSLGHLVKTFGHYLSVAALGVLLLFVWNALDSRWEATGYKTQLVTLLLAEGLVFGRIGLRLALLGGQVALYRKLTAPA